MKRAIRYALLGTAALALALSAPLSAVETIEAGKFAVDVSTNLAVRYNGKTIFSGDRCVAFNGFKPNAPILVETQSGAIFRKDKNIFTVVSKKGRNSMRREIMVTPEALHITFEIKAFGPTGGSDDIQYDLISPAETLDGAAYTVAAGLGRAPRQISTGVFSVKDKKPFEYFFQTGRYVALKLPGGECALDFNPGGVWQGESNYGENYRAALYHDGSSYHFAMLFSGAKFGGIFSGKIIIRPGAIPYEAVHATECVEYHIEFPIALAVNFSENDADGRYQACPARVIPGKPFRWQKPEAVRIVTRETGGLLYRDFVQSADGTSAGAFEMEARSGLYLLTLNVHDAKEDTGPFDIAGTDGMLCKGVVVKRGERWIKTFPIRFRAGKVSLRLSGQWKLNALTLQPILYEAEDFIFDHPFWNMKIEG